MSAEHFHAMGTTISLLVPTRALPVARIVARSLFGTWEDTLSRFRAGSELLALNRRAGRPVTVSPLLYAVLTAAIEAAQATNGIFDLSMHGQMRQIGYDRSFEQLAEDMPEPTMPARPGGGWRGIELDPERRQVTLPVGVGLDLGGIAKGLAVDAVVARLRQLGFERALINAGGDLAVLGVPPGSDAWPIAVPAVDGFWTMPLGRGAMATSGRSRRRWRRKEADRAITCSIREPGPRWKPSSGR